MKYNNMKHDRKGMDSEYKKMPKGKKYSKNEYLSSENEIVEEKQGDYNTRYKGLVSPKDEIVESHYTPSYNSRYN